jgi:hypothetical protein
MATAVSLSYQGENCIMNKSTSQRSEEARRQAQAALIEARQQQDALLQERATMFASETQKVENLRAQRLAKIESDRIAGKAADAEAEALPAARRRRLRAA